MRGKSPQSILSPRLTGTTWYALDLAPHGYWQVWTDSIVHRIHLRVLRQIKKVSEEDLLLANCRDPDWRSM
ncbi:MAG: hypothetical protein ACR2NU_15250 [Aeoliella sp.]